MHGPSCGSDAAAARRELTAFAGRLVGPQDPSYDEDRAVYAAWGLDASTTDEKIARTRAALIVNAGRLLRWDETTGSVGVFRQPARYANGHLAACHFPLREPDEAASRA